MKKFCILILLAICPCYGLPLRAQNTKAPTEDELKDLLRAMTLEAFENVHPHAGGLWMIDEKSFSARDQIGVNDLEELTCMLRSIPASRITVTYSPLKDFLHHWDDFFECNRPASYTCFAPVTYAHIQPSGRTLPHSYTCIVFFWYPPTKDTPCWLLKKLQLF
jgi:hypothetical protein